MSSVRGLLDLLIRTLCRIVVLYTKHKYSNNVNGTRRIQQGRAKTENPNHERHQNKRTWKNVRKIECTNERTQSR